MNNELDFPKAEKHDVTNSTSNDYNLNFLDLLEGSPSKAAKAGKPEPDILSMMIAAHILHKGDSNQSGKASGTGDSNSTNPPIEPPAAPKHSVDENGMQNTVEILDYFVQKGLTPQQSAGIVGNFDQESKGNPDQHQYDGGPGYGLGQWEAGYGGRLNLLKDFQAHDKDHRALSDLNLQLDFTWYELNSTEASSLSTLRGASTARSAAEIFERLYERPDPYYANVWARQNYADQALTEWQHHR